MSVGVCYLFLSDGSKAPVGATVWELPGCVAVVRVSRETAVRLLARAAGTPGSMGVEACSQVCGRLSLCRAA